MFFPTVDLLKFAALGFSCGECLAVPFVVRVRLDFICSYMVVY